MNLVILTSHFYCSSGRNKNPPALAVGSVNANIAATIGGYTYNARKIRIVGMLINSPLWIIYDIAVGSWAGILDEIVSEASMLISILRYGWKNMDSLETEA